jgi:hypothetical protein
MPEHLTVEEIDRMPFFFIVGRGRSGTTLLQTMLDANPAVIVPFESRLIMHLQKEYAHVTKWDAALVGKFLADLSTDVYYSKYWKMEESALKKAIAAIPAESLSFSILCKLVYLSFPSAYHKSKVRIIGDKNPVYSIFIEELRTIFPEAKFIHLVRDHRDNVVSFKKVFKKDGSPAVLAKGWKIYNEIIEHSKKRDPKHFLTLRYEDLVSDLALTLQRVCDFLSIPFDPGMLEYQSGLMQENGNILGKVMAELHPNLTGPVTAAQVDKWKMELSSNDLSLIESMVGKTAERYSYHPAGIRKQFFFRSVYAAFRNRLQIAVTKTYYRIPLYLRKRMRKISGFLNKRFGYSNIYNQEDFRFRE